jgi:RNA polymerase sigma-70 factor (ECF subfamily)
VVQQEIGQQEAVVLQAIREKAAQTAQGDLEQTFRVHSGLVFRTAYRITGNAADAEDVLQTVFMRLFRRDSGTPQAGVEVLASEESYLRRAAINVSLDVVRQRQKERSEPLTEFNAGPARPGYDDGAGGLDERDLRESLRRALARIQPMHAEIFALRFFEERSNQEIARMLGISQVRVAVTLHRTRQQLQKELGAQKGDRK